MNLSNLFAKQSELDAYIIKTKGLEGQDLLKNKVLALMVELAECANEWRGFKHWSDDREPRTDKLLVEYVDCIHFILSIGNELKFDKNREITPSTFNDDDITQQFSFVYDCIATFSSRVLVMDYIAIFRTFLELGEMLGFTWDQIEAAYNAKWEINKQRQENGY